MTKHSVLDEPMSDSEVVLGVFPKNQKEDVRVTLSKYKGLDLLGIRVWYTTDDGHRKPGSKGLSIRASLIPQLLSSVERARDVAMDKGLLGKKARPAADNVLLEAEEMPDDDEAE